MFSLAHIKPKRRKISVRLRLPKVSSLFVLDGGPSNPINQICNLGKLPTHNYPVEEVQIYLSLKYFICLPVDVFHFGFSVGRLIAALRSSKASAVITLEKSDQKNSLLAVSYALPHLKIVSVQHSRFFESSHLHNPWANPWNVRIMTWGDHAKDMAESNGRSSRIQVAIGSINRQEDSSLDIPNGRDIPLLIVLKAENLDADGNSIKKGENQLRSSNTLNLLKLLGEYARIKQTSLLFLSDPRQSREAAESDLRVFEKVSGAHCEYVEELRHEAIEDSKSSRPNSFAVLKASRVIVGLNSSMLWEAVASCQPAVCVSFGTTAYMQFPRIDQWVLRDPDINELSTAIETISRLSANDLLRRSHDFSHYLRSQSLGNSRKILERYLTAAVKNCSFDEAEADWRQNSSTSVTERSKQ